MKKAVTIVLLNITYIMNCSLTKQCNSCAQVPCSPCSQALLKPNTLVPFNPHHHGAPTQAVATLCPELVDDYCGGHNLQLISIGGFLPECVEYPQSIRLYQLTSRNSLREIPLSDIDEAIPSEFIYSTAMCCFNNKPYIIYSGAPNRMHEALWIYRYDIINDTFAKVCSWAFADNQSDRCLLSAAVNCKPCIDPDTQEPFLQIAAVGTPDSSGHNSILLFKFQEDEQGCSLKLMNEISVKTTLYKAVWCTFKDCPLLTVGGKATLTDHCSYANLFMYHVNCSFGVLPAVTPVLVGNRYVDIHGIATCCDKKPFPLFAVVGTFQDNGEQKSIVQIYFYSPRGSLIPLAGLPDEGTIDGFYFTIAFDPGCRCQSVTFAGGTCEPRCPCSKNILTYRYSCNKSGKHPVTMEPVETAFGSFDDTVTDLAFCKNLAGGGCYDMIVTSENSSWIKERDPLCKPKHQHGEIGLFKVKFCPEHKSCNPKPICIRKNFNFDPVLD